MKYAITILMVLSLSAGVLSKTVPMKRHVKDAPQTASYQFSIPSSMMNPDMHGNPWSQIRLYIDGAPQRDFRGQIAAGRHTIRVVTGAIQIEQVSSFEAGKNYIIELVGEIKIR